MTSEILQYLGTLFIGFEITRMVGVLNMPLVLPFAILLSRVVFPRMTYFRDRRGIYTVFRIIIKALLIILVLILLLVLALGLLLGLITLSVFIIDAVPNLIYRKMLSMVPREEIITQYRKFRLDMFAPDKTEEQVLEMLGKPIPWVGLIGLVLITVGFIMKI